MVKSNQEWNGETGFITETMLHKSILYLTLLIFYVVGPPAMLDAMREILNKAGVNDDNIRTEKFSGY